MLLSPYISPSPPLSPCPKVYSLSLFLQCCPANKFFCTIFLGFVYMHCVCVCVCVLVAQSCLFATPWGVYPTRLLHPCNFPGKNTGMGCHFLLHICISKWYLSFTFWLTSLCIIGSRFIHFIRTDSNAFLYMAEKWDRYQDHLQVKNTKKQMAVWGGITDSCEKKRSKQQREKERYTHLNAEFQRARRDKKAFLSDQYK